MKWKIWPVAQAKLVSRVLKKDGRQEQNVGKVLNIKKRQTIIEAQTWDYRAIIAL